MWHSYIQSYAKMEWHQTHLYLTLRFAFMTSMFNVGYYSLVTFFIDTTSSSLTSNLQMYKLLWLRTLLLTAKLFSFSYVVASNYFWLCGLITCFIWVSLSCSVCLMVLFGLLAVVAFNVLTEAEFFKWWLAITLSRS